jgi:hypothetical protein
MKNFLTRLIFIVIAVGCTHVNMHSNDFSSFSDTLVIEMQKKKGIDIFTNGARQVQLMDTSNLPEPQFNYLKNLKFPKGFTNLKVTSFAVDFKPSMFIDYKKGIFDSLFFSSLLKKYDLDTTNLPIPDLSDNSVCMMVANRRDSSVIVVDENNNKEFTDDPVREITPFVFKSNKNLIPCKYKIYNGREFKQDSAWLNIGTMNLNSIWYSVSQIMEASLFLAKEEYQLGVIGEGFTFDRPLLCVLGQHGIMKDSIIIKDVVKRGEYIKLNDNYYQFNKISNDGRLITLIKETNFRNKVGTQVGMLAPGFKCKTINNDTLIYEKCWGKYVLIANMSGCTPDSYDAYKKLIKAGLNNLIIIGVNYEIKENFGGNLVDASIGFNKEFYEIFRHEYSSYDCYLIDTDGRIADNFDIFYWEKSLRDKFEWK